MSKVGLLLSGGMDSYALAVWQRPDVAITVDYGQLPAQAEIRAAERLAQYLSIEHQIIKVDLRSVGSGDLAGTPPVDIAPATDWWPYRNQALFTIAAMRLVRFGVDTLHIASVRSDGIHRDGTAEFIEKLNELMAFQEGGMCIEAPAISLSTAELVRCAAIPYPLLAWAHSCHVGNIACGRCRGCVKHREVVAELGYA